MRVVLCLVMIMSGAVIAAPARSQETAVPKETRCWLGSVTFSAGALMNSGAGVTACVADRGWVAQEGEAGDSAGCLLDGDLSSAGAVVGVSNNDQFWLQCEADGRWSKLARDAAPE